MPPNTYNRYNVNGFVEELPQLPENRSSHACAALPTTGVRPVQCCAEYFVIKYGHMLDVNYK